MKSQSIKPWVTSIGKTTTHTLQDLEFIRHWHNKAKHKSVLLLTHAHFENASIDDQAKQKKEHFFFLPFNHFPCRRDDPDRNEVSVSPGPPPSDLRLFQGATTCSP